MKLIDREKLKNILCDQCAEIAGICQRGSCGSTRMLDSMPVVDAVPALHGHWEVAIGYDINRKVKCSECNRMNFEPSNYCPNCGAKMDEENE